MEESSEPKKSYRDKPMLTVDQQIAHLKKKGITFNSCTEKDISKYLAEKCQFFKVMSYRKLFEKHVGGDNDGQYVNLDFSQLQYLAGLDRRMRDVLLLMTLDVEHFAAVKLLETANVKGEDGYQIIRDYMGSVSESRRSYIENELKVRSSDVYCGALIQKYRQDMPIWIFVEIVSFGTFIGLMKFCAERWDDDEMLTSHYLLKKTKSVRNACAHSQCILNELSTNEAKERIAPVVTQAVSQCGINKRLRLKKLRNPRLAQIATLLYQYCQIAPQGSTVASRKSALSEFFRYFNDTKEILPESNPAISSIVFLYRLTAGFGLLN